MLVLSRKKREAVVIGDDYIRIVVTDIRGDNVRFGIYAPENVSIHREEVYLEIKKQGTRNLTPAPEGP